MIFAIGLMSGTSLDGVDAALVKIENEKFTLEKYVMLPYESSFKERIFSSINDDKVKLSVISSLNFELGYKFKEAIDLLLENTNLKYSDISYVASHGQTIWHDPHSFCPNTLQIGEASVITALTNITCISNFRVMDVSLGGEGAPLVPFAEYVLFKDYPKNVIFQNIGGISNLTYLKVNGTIDDILAFDEGPGNMMIDYFVNKYYNLPYDEGGKIALKGKLIKEIFDDLIKDEFIYAPFPKSTGRERYNANLFEEKAKELNFDKYKKEDIITTISELTVFAIVYNYKTYIKDFDEVIVSGGGSHNEYIMQRLNESLDGKVKKADDISINSDAKEALCFAILGYMTLNNKTSNVKKVTGAREYAILGNITPSKKG